MASRAAIGARPANVWLAQSGALMPWAPVAMGCGVGLYFAQRIEPGQPALAAVAGLGLVAVIGALRLRGHAVLTPALWAVALTATGFALAAWRAHHVAGPVLDWRYYGPVQGRIVGIDRSSSDAVRLTLDRVVLDRLAPARTPRRVRVTLHATIPGTPPRAGMTVATTAHLSPPGGPVEPGGFDFRRHAWFLGLGAVGYTRNPLVAIAPANGGTPLLAARLALSKRVQTALPGPAGATAAAIMTGDRAGLPAATVEDLRRANLAHLLAISGLHMGLVAGFVFAVLRLGLALIPLLALRLAVRKLAAVAALVAAAGYLALSGGNVATERAFVMAAVMLGAVLIDRRAFSLRAVAVAAMIVLALRPEALLEPGFQMSFAATAALVAAFNALRDRWPGGLPGPRWLRPVLAVVISSAVAGTATAPFAAAHFNQYAQYGLLANLLSVPLMGALVMPAAVLAACLLPLGLEALALEAMGLGLSWILGVAHWVTGLEGARRMVPTPGPEVLPLMALGLLTVILWQGRTRWAGLAPVAAAALLWIGVERPALLIAEDGGLVGVMTPQGRALSHARGKGFTAGIWLENDGDPADQAAAAARWPAADPPVPVRALRGKRDLAALEGCTQGAWLVLGVAPPDPARLDPLPCRVLTPSLLRRTGTLAVFGRGDALRIVAARQVTGSRLWSPQPPPPAALLSRLLPQPRKAAGAVARHLQRLQPTAIRRSERPFPGTRRTAPSAAARRHWPRERGGGGTVRPRLAFQ